jgi:hypothetical protein
MFRLLRRRVWPQARRCRPGDAFSRAQARQADAKTPCRTRDGSSASKPSTLMQGGGRNSLPISLSPPLTVPRPRSALALALPSLSLSPAPAPSPSPSPSLFPSPHPLFLSRCWRSTHRMRPGAIQATVPESLVSCREAEYQTWLKSPCASIKIPPPSTLHSCDT